MERRRRDLFAWALSAALVLLAALAAPCLVGYVYTYDDLGAFHLPIRVFYAQQLARGEPFDWAPQLFSGFYLTGEGQLGEYHPLHLVLYCFLPLEAAWAWELLAGYAFMLAGAYLFLRRLLGRRDAAMFGSLVFTFSGFNLLHFVHPNAIAVVAHLPWLLWTIDLMLTETARRRVLAAQAGAALLTGSQLLLGHPQSVWFSLLTEAAYISFVLTGTRYTAKRYAKRPDCTSDADCGTEVAFGAPPWCRLVVAKATGVMLGGIQLLPTLDLLSHSLRQSVDTAFVDDGSLHPWNLVQLVAPYLFTHRVVGQNTHELGFYMGAVPLVLIVWLLARRRELGPLRRPVLAAAGFGVLALLLAFGRYGPIYRFQRLVPVAGSFRFPCRYTLLVSLCVAVLSAIALVMLAGHGEQSQKTPRRFTPVWLVVAASVAAAIAGLVLRGHPLIGNTTGILAGPLLISSAAVLLVLADRGAHWALAGLVLFGAADLGCYGLSYAALAHAERFEAYLSRTRTPPARPGGRVVCGAYRFDRSGLRTGNQITLAGWHRADGYAALEPDCRLDYRKLCALRAAGVRWVWQSEATATTPGLIRHSRHWLEVPEPLERVRLVTRAVTSDDPARDIARIPLETAALVEQPLRLPPGLPGTVTMLSDRPGRIHLRVDCPDRQLLVVSERYHSGWQAELDGRPRPVLRVNGDFMGCLVGPGEQVVRLSFQPRSLLLGRAVSLLGLVLMCGWLVAGFLVLRRGGKLSRHGASGEPVRRGCAA